MNALRLAAAGLLVLGLTAFASAEEKKDDNKTKLVGTWVVTKADEGTVPVNSVITFAKDGKMKVTHKQGDQDVTVEGTYTVDADSFSFALKVGDEVKKQKITIKKLTDEVLSTADDKGKTVELKKKK